MSNISIFAQQSNAGAGKEFRKARRGTFKRKDGKHG